VSTAALAACGDRGGPGYRGPGGKCVGWAEFGRVCGKPPEKRCSAENVQDRDGGRKTASPKDDDEMTDVQEVKE
jgi:hypothetical protein